MTPPAFFNLLEFLETEVDSGLQMNTLRVFLFIASRGSCTQNEAELSLGMSGAACSRNIAYWTDRRFDKGVGMNYVSKTMDDTDRRHRNLELTVTGKQFYVKLLEKMA